MLEKLSYTAACLSATLLQTLILLLDMLADGFSDHSKPASGKDYQEMLLLMDGKSSQSDTKDKNTQGIRKSLVFGNY